MLWVCLSRSWQGWRSAMHVVKPETVLAWHRLGFAKSRQRAIADKGLRGNPNRSNDGTNDDCN
jgi:hypothetical protein